MQRILTVLLLLVCSLVLYAPCCWAGEIHLAAQQGDVVKLSQLLTTTPSLLNSLDDQRCTPLYYAVAHKQDAAVQLLLDKGASPAYVCDSQGYTVLHLAAMEGRTDFVAQFLAKGVSPNALSRLKIAPLHLAALFGHQDIVNLLLAKGARADARRTGGESPLLMACQGVSVDPSIYLQIVQTLIDHGADVNVKDSQGKTPLHEVHNTDIAALLFAHKADITAKDNSGNTPLMHAVCDPALTELFLAHGADLHVRNSMGETALFYTVDVKVANLLIAKGIDINARNTNGMTALLLYAGNGNAVMFNRLLAAGADVKLADNLNETPLHRAAANGNISVIHTLLAHGASMTARNKAGLTPFMEAVSTNVDVKVLDYLLAHGASLKDVDNNGATLLHLATRNFTPAANTHIAWLIQKGFTIHAKDKNGDTPLHEVMSSNGGSLAALKALLAVAKPSDIDVKDVKGVTPLAAVFRRDIRQTARPGEVPQMVALLLAKGADPNLIQDLPGKMSSIPRFHFMEMGQVITSISAKLIKVDIHDKTGNSLLIYAVRVNNIPAVTDLLKRGVDVNGANNDGETPLWYAANAGMQQLLIDHGANVMALTHNLQTLLHRAVNMGSPEMASTLIDKGVPINTKDAKGRTAFTYAMLNSSNDERANKLVELLIAHGANINEADEGGVQPIHMVASRGAVSLITLLLDKGADVNAVTKNGDTPLHFAADLTTAQLLIARGAKATTANINGQTPLQTIVQWADQPEIVDLLVAQGADVNARDNYHLTPIFMTQHIEVARELIAKGAVVNCVALNGATPLHFATKEQLVNGDYITFLLQQHLDPNAQDQQGRTPLHWAATGSNPGVIAALIAGGAKVDIRDNGGNTPLALAQQAKLDDAVLELQQGGAKE